MIKPAYLKKGDTVGILSTARFISKEAIQPAIKLLDSWGLNVSVGSSIGLQENQMAGSDQEKILDLQTMLDDPGISAIWCAKGGYGTARLLDHLDFLKFQKAPKWICGFSDITALHLHLQMVLGVASLHCLMPSTLKANAEESIDSLKSALFGEALLYSNSGHHLNRRGESTGIVLGGNLSLIYSLQGNPEALNSSGSILFLEDLDEYLYHVDRMMLNLKRSGMLSQLNGLIIGGMTSMNDNSTPFGKDAEEIIADYVAPFDYPVAFGFPSGHQHVNSALKMGVSAKLAVSEQGVSLGFE